jgi:EmrB/QacA subfamily drug resistance transporter
MTASNLAHKTKMWILLGVLLSSFVAALDSTIVGTALPKIIGDLEGMELYAWPFTAYILCMAVTIPVFGRLADMLGFKPIYTIGMIFFLGGSALCGAAQSMIQLIIFRGLQGIGGGMLTANSLGIIGATFAPAERAKYIGLGSSFMALASIVGPSLGGLITDNLSWRWVFYVNLPVGAIALAVILLTLPQFKDRVSHQIDFLGILTFIVAVVPLLLALTWAGDKYPWGSVEIIGMLAFSAAMIVLFVIVERRAAEPIVPMTFFRNSIFNVCSLGIFLSAGVSIGAVIFAPLFIQGVIGSSATSSGMIMTPFMLSIVVTAGIGGAIISRTLKYKALVLLGFLVMGVGLFLMSQMTATTAHSTVIGYMIIVGAGMGMSLPVFSLAAQNAVPQRDVGSVTSLVQFFRLLGGTMFSAVFGSALVSSMASGLSTVDLGALPDQLRSFLQNPQAVANPEAVEGIRTTLPAALLPAFESALTQVRAVLAGSITDVFFIGIFMVAAGFIVVLFLKEVVLRKELVDEGRSQVQETPAAA